MNALLKKYQDIVLYVIFGVLTTLVNVIVYWVGAHAMGLPTLPATILAWILAVLFAYVTNRTWVFHSRAKGAGEIRREIAAFFTARLATGILDWVCMFVFVDLLKWNDVPVKLAANILVIILNYILSKLVIFRQKKG